MDLHQRPEETQQEQSRHCSRVGVHFFCDTALRFFTALSKSIRSMTFRNTEVYERDSLNFRRMDGDRRVAFSTSPRDGSLSDGLLEEPSPRRAAEESGEGRRTSGDVASPSHHYLGSERYR